MLAAWNDIRSLDRSTNRFDILTSTKLNLFQWIFIIYGLITSFIDSLLSNHNLYFELTTKRFVVLHLPHLIIHKLMSSLFPSSKVKSAETPGSKTKPHCLHIVRFISGSLQMIQSHNKWMRKKLLARISIQNSSYMRCSAFFEIVVHCAP